MRYKINISLTAEYELDDITLWYENQKEGLGFRFGEVILEAFELLRESPYLFAPYNVHYRRMVLPRFPYSIIYEVSEEERIITILRVVHQKRGVD